MIAFPIKKWMLQDVSTLMLLASYFFCFVFRLIECKLTSDEDVRACYLWFLSTSSKNDDTTRNERKGKKTRGNNESSWCVRSDTLGSKSAYNCGNARVVTHLFQYTKLYIRSPITRNTQIISRWKNYIK